MKTEDFEKNMAILIHNYISSQNTGESVVVAIGILELQKSNLFDLKNKLGRPVFEQHRRFK